MDVALFSKLEESVHDASLKLNAFVESQKAGMQAAHEQHKRVVAQDKENIRALEQKERDLQMQVKDHSKIAELHQAEIKALQQEAEEMAGVSRAAAERTRMLKQQHDELLKRKEQLEADVVAKVRLAEESVHCTDKAKAMFAKWLGLRFERVDDSVMRFVFTNVDSHDQSREFTFTTRVCADGLYALEACQPVVKSSDLLEELNKSNDFSKFAREMRKRFAESC
eukprot:m.215100 g.215100  ORF g.215100 m.215100 type:complete len:224 (+) comp39435_c0_seq1:122-793(+)